MFKFNPDLVLVSSGFDAALGDPLGNYKITPAGFAHMLKMLCGLANGNVILALEVIEFNILYTRFNILFLIYRVVII